MAHDVFISYSSQDKAVADAACAGLEARKIRCWIAPRDVLAGTEYAEALLNAIEDARAMVLIFSAHANGSPHVRREVERAVSNGKIILPFRIENVLPSRAMEFCLGNTHWLDALTPPLEMRIAELVSSIGRLLEPTAKQPATSVADDRPDRSRNPQARACHERGVARYHHQDYDQAIVEISESIRLDPTVAWAYNDRGSAWLQKGDFAKAISDFNEGIRLDPSPAWPYHDRGTALFKSGDYAAAIRDYTTALQLDPTLAWSHHDRGACHLQLGEFSAAIADFTAAIRLNPDLVWAYRNRSAAYEKVGKGELARADQAVVRRLEPVPSDTLSILYRNRHGQSVLMVQTFARDPKWPTAVYHISQPDGERRPLRCCFKVFGNRVGPIADETKESCIQNAIENILHHAPDIVGLGGMGSTARRIQSGLNGRGYKGRIDYWGGDVGIDAAEFLRRNEVEPPF